MVFYFKKCIYYALVSSVPEFRMNSFGILSFCVSNFIANLIQVDVWKNFLYRIIMIIMITIVLNDIAEPDEIIPVLKLS